MYFPYSHKSWQRITLASQRFQFLLAFRWSGSCYQFQVYAANCKQAEHLLTYHKNKKIQNLLPSGMFHVSNSKQVEHLRWEGRGRERMERKGGTGRGQLAPWVQGDRRPCLTAVNGQSFFTFWRNTNYTLGGLLYIFLQIFCIGRERKSVKNYENWLTFIRQSYCNTKVTFSMDHFVLV